METEDTKPKKISVQRKRGKKPADVWIVYYIVH